MSSVDMLTAFGSRAWRTVLGDEPLAVAGRTTAVLICVSVGGGLWWQRKVKKLKEKELIVIERESVRNKSRREYMFSKERSFYELDATARTWADFLELDQKEVVHVEEKELGKIKFVSLHDYFNSLHVPGGVNFRKVAVTFLAKVGMELALPFLGNLPQESLRSDLPMDPFVGKIIQNMLRNLISPVTISAIAMTTHKTAQRLVENRYDPVEDMRSGVDGAAFKQIFTEEVLPNPFDFDQHFAPLVEKVSELITGTPLMFTEAVPVQAEFLPGLHYGSPNVQYRESTEEQAMSRVLCAVFNRLNANLLDLAEEKNNCESRHDTFQVQVHLGGADHLVTTVDRLVHLFMSDSAYNVRVGIRTLLTSFSKSMHVHDIDGEVYHVPLAIPMRTGITGIDGSDIVIPMSHAGIPIILQGPLFSQTKGVGVECYQNVGSFTGWHPYIWRKWPWHLGYERWHDEFFGNEWGAEKQIELVRGATIISVISNIAANESSLALGGYGFFGVCLDSVAVVQYAVTRTTTIFPLLLSGQARTLLLNVAARLSSALEDSQKFSNSLVESCNNLRHAIVNLDTDIDIPPKDVVRACKRIIRTLPESSLFRQVETSRQQAIELIDYMKRTYYESEEGQLKQPQTSSMNVVTVRTAKESEGGSIALEKSTTKPCFGFTCSYPVEVTRREILLGLKERGLVPAVASTPRCIFQWCPFTKVNWKRSIEQNLIVSSYFCRSGLVDKAALMETLRLASVAEEMRIPVQRMIVPFHVLDGADHGEFVKRIKVIVDQTETVPCWVLKGSKSNNATQVHFITKKNIQAIPTENQKDGERWLLQTYIRNPLLFHGRKFHIRCNVLCVGRLNVFVHQSCVLHVCCEPYTESQWEEKAVHVSNHVFQSTQVGYAFDRNQRTLEDLEEHLDLERGRGTGVKSIVMKNIVQAVQTTFKAIVDYGKKSDFFATDDSFELFGFDFLVENNEDDGFPVKLLEVNGGPALEGHEEMNNLVCHEIVNDTLNVVLRPFLNEDGSLKKKIEPVSTSGTKFLPAFSCYDGRFLSERMVKFLQYLSHKECQD